nr:YxiJ family protein [Bacillus niameyensis]
MDIKVFERQLVLINEKLLKPFPYRDTDKIQEDYGNIFAALSDDDNWLTLDFNTYCMNIAGTLSYVLIGKSNEIPKDQIEMLRFYSLSSLNNIDFLKII